MVGSKYPACAYAALYRCTLARDIEAISFRLSRRGQLGRVSEKCMARIVSPGQRMSEERSAVAAGHGASRREGPVDSGEAQLSRVPPVHSLCLCFGRVFRSKFFRGNQFEREHPAAGLAPGRPRQQRQWRANKAEEGAPKKTIAPARTDRASSKIKKENGRACLCGSQLLAVWRRDGFEAPGAGRVRGPPAASRFPGARGGGGWAQVSLEPPRGQTGVPRGLPCRGAHHSRGRVGAVPLHFFYPWATRAPAERILQAELEMS